MLSTVENTYFFGACGANLSFFGDNLRIPVFRGDNLRIEKDPSTPRTIRTPKYFITGFLGFGSPMVYVTRNGFRENSAKMLDFLFCVHSESFFAKCFVIFERFRQFSRGRKKILMKIFDYP